MSWQLKWESGKPILFSSVLERKNYERERGLLCLNFRRMFSAGEKNKKKLEKTKVSLRIWYIIICYVCMNSLHVSSAVKVEFQYSISTFATISATRQFFVLSVFILFSFAYYSACGYQTHILATLCFGVLNFNFWT